MVTYKKSCPVPREVFEECAKAAAPYLFAFDTESWNMCREKGLLVDHILKPEDAPKIVKLSPPTFRKRAKQFLLPEKFGELPDYFFEKQVKKAKDLVVFKDGE